MSTQLSRDGGKPPSDRPLLVSWLPTIIWNIVLPTVTYIVLTGAVHLQPVPALLVSGVWPAVELALTMRRQHNVDEFSVFALIALALGVITTVFSGNVRAVFLKDSLVTGLFGLVLLASMVFGRPLMFYFGRRFATDGSKAQRDWWNGLWQYPAFRRSQRILNVVWGTAFFAEAAVRAILTLMLGPSPVVVLNNVLPYLVLFALIFGTVSYGRRAQASAVRRFGAAAGRPSEQIVLGVPDE